MQILSRLAKKFAAKGNSRAFYGALMPRKVARAFGPISRLVKGNWESVEDGLMMDLTRKL
jgi:hypothetical protein